MDLPRYLLTLAALLTGGAAAEPVLPPARPAVPFAEYGDVGCYWMMHDPLEKWIRGSIGLGDEDPILSLVDAAFDSWSNSEHHGIEVSAGGPARRLPATAWASTGDAEGPGSIGFYMNADLRRLIGGATSLQIWKQGRPVYNGLLARTPTAAALDACVRPPKGEGSDEE
ncbi:MAG TPA: hypothetical protein VF582_03215 [Allosphingosinicella sp.]